MYNGRPNKTLSWCFFLILLGTFFVELFVSNRHNIDVSVTILCVLLEIMFFFKSDFFLFKSDIIITYRNEIDLIY